MVIDEKPAEENTEMDQEAAPVPADVEPTTMVKILNGNLLDFYVNRMLRNQLPQVQAEVLLGRMFLELEVVAQQQLGLML